MKQHSKHTHELKQWLKPLACAFAVTLTLTSTAFAAVNSNNNGQNVQGGTYYNTAGNRTVFQNTNKTGLWLKAGNTVRGLEADAAGNATGNGGHVHFYAPGQVVRLDGNIDVSALRGSSGAYTGNGGRVSVDSAFLYQSGNIYANGANGGTVAFNVGSATVASGAKIEAFGETGAGGRIAIKANNVVDVQSGVIMDSSGKVVSTYDTNVISIEGAAVNNAGILRANGIANADGSGARGGIIRLVANGGANVTEDVNSIASAEGMFTAGEAATVSGRINDLASNQNSRVNNSGTLEANGANGTDGKRGGDGGTIWMFALKNGQVNNSGTVNAKGGSGGDALLNSTGGRGGQGGGIQMSATNKITNTGSVNASGGRGGKGDDHGNGGQGGTGGLVLISGTQNVAGNGSVSVQGGNGGNSGDDYAVGGNGGNGGTVLVPSPWHFPGQINVKGGQGGYSSKPWVVAHNGHKGNVDCAPPPCDPPSFHIPPDPPPPPPPVTPPTPPVVTGTPPYVLTPIVNDPGSTPATEIAYEGAQGRAFLAEESEEEYPETVLRRHLEHQISEAQKKPVKRKVRVRGYW